MRRILFLIFAVVFSVLIACGKEDAPPPAKGIPALSTVQMRMLENTSDFHRSFDEAPLYALLGAANTWPRDAWGGATPIQVVEQKKERTLQVELEPQAHRGEAMLIEGMFVTSTQGVPCSVNGQLSRFDPQWGNTLNCWIIRLGRNPDKDPQVMVYFPSTRALPEVRPGNYVRVVARFFKVFTDEVYVEDPKINPGKPMRTGRVENYCAFIGGNAQLLRNASLPLSPYFKLVLILVFVAIGFGGLWFVKSYLRDASTGRGSGFKTPTERWEERLEREREEELDGEEVDEDLPEDPAEALKKLKDGENE